MENYESYQPTWESNASVRTKPRRILESNEHSGFYFPPEQQPLSIHPLIEETGLKDKVLIHSLYKYLNDIANIEKDIINDTSYKITKNAYSVKFPVAAQHDALSIIIDESYHAYVALDFLMQVEAITGISSLPLPGETSLSHAIRNISEQLPRRSKDNFALIATCIAEHALTNNLISIAKSKDVCRAFFFVMQDHAQDEGRHARFFEKILKYFWHALSDVERDEIGVFLPQLIHQYFNPFEQQNYDKSVLKYLGLRPDQVDQIIHDTYASWHLDIINEDNVVAKQMIALLRRTGVFEHPNVKAGFAKFQIF